MAGPEEPAEVRARVQRAYPTITPQGAKPPMFMIEQTTRGWRTVTPEGKTVDHKTHGDARRYFHGLGINPWNIEIAVLTNNGKLVLL